MHLPTLLSALLLSTPLLALNAKRQNDDDPTITSSASLAECTGDSFTKWLSCSSSIDAEISKCSDADVKCGCELASKRFNCLTSHCPSAISSLCATSLILDSFCSVAGIHFPSSANSNNAACPTADIRSALATIIPDIPSNVRSLLPSELQSLIAGISGGTTGVTATATGTRMSAPSQTGAAGRVGEGEIGGVGGVWGVGVVMGSVVVGGLAVWL